MPIERERRFLISTAGQAVVMNNASHHSVIQQGYLLIEHEREVRVRLAMMADGTKSAEITEKIGSGERRIESSPIVIAPNWAGTIINHIPNVVKLRRFSDGWELNVFLSEGLEKLILIERELAEDEDCPPFPEWLAEYVEKEVTEDPAYESKNLALSIWK